MLCAKAVAVHGIHCGIGILDLEILDETITFAEFGCFIADHLRVDANVNIQSMQTDRERERERERERLRVCCCYNTLMLKIGPNGENKRLNVSSVASAGRWNTNKLVASVWYCNDCGEWW
jgi:hypothetical protein